MVQGIKGYIRKKKAKEQGGPFWAFFGSFLQAFCKISPREIFLSRRGFFLPVSTIFSRQGIPDHGGSICYCTSQRAWRLLEVLDPSESPNSCRPLGPSTTPLSASLSLSLGSLSRRGGSLSRRASKPLLKPLLGKASSQEVPLCGMPSSELPLCHGLSCELNCVWLSPLQLTCNVYIYI